MNPETNRLIIGLTVIIAFVGMISVVLFGVVDIQSPEMAKLVGSLFGFFTGMASTIILTYFREP